jgi:hypothetical protein
MSERKKQIKLGVVVAVPSSGRPVPIEWAMAIATLAYPVGQNHAWQISKADPASRVMTRDIQRETLVERALALGAEYLMFFDDDTVPPSHAIQSLWYVLSQNPKAAIAAGIYCTKSDFPEPIVYMNLGDGAFWNWTLGDIFKCQGIGTGCMMVRLSALKDIPKPWFKDALGNVAPHKAMCGDIELDVVSETMSDDLYFCRKVTAAGYEIIAHGGVLPLHIGQDGKQFHMPDDSYPVVSYMKKRAEFVQKGLDPTNPEHKISVPEVKI